jgi:hypothetical protein
MDVKEIDIDARVHCDKCDGCGKTCNIPRIGTKPWSYLVGSDDEATTAEVDGKIICPETCDLCHGIGRKRPVPVPDDF